MARPAERPLRWKGWARYLDDRRWRLMAILLVVALAATVRLVHLSADPPFDISWSQDLSTDPPQYTSYARNALVFGDWNPFNDDRLVFFQKNITGFFSYLLFLVTGPGIGPSHLIAAILNLVGVLFLAWGTARAFGLIAGLAAAFFLSVNYLFVSYGRVPFLEVASNATLAVAFFGIVASVRRWWWAIVGGVVAGAGTFFGKVTALHAAPIFLLAYALVGWQAKDDLPTRRWSRPLGYAAGMGFVFIVWYVFAYLSASSEVLAYLKEQSVQLYGKPVGLSSVRGFISQWFSFGINNFGVSNGLLTWAPVLGISGLLGMVFMVTRYLRRDDVRLPSRESSRSGPVPLEMREGRLLSRISPAALALVGWFWSAYAILMPFNYRPVRYQIVLLYPLAGAAGWLIGRMAGREDPPREEQSGRLVWYAVPILAIILATGLQHLLISSWIDPRKSASVIRGVKVALPLGFFVAGAWFWVARQMREKSKGPRSRIRGVLDRVAGLASRVRGRGVLELVAGLALLVSLADQGRYFVKWWSQAQYSIAAANDDLRKVLGEEAVLTGSYATALTQTGRLHNFPAMFGVAQPDPEFFKKFPVTHVAIVEPSDDPFFSDYKQIAGQADRVAQYTIRNLPITVFRVAELGGNPRASTYQPSPFERLKSDVNSHPGDTLLSYASRWVADSGNCYTAWRWLGDILSRRGQLENALDAYRHATVFFNDDYVLWARFGDVAWEMFRKGAGRDMRQQAVDAWRHAQKLSPGNSKLAERLAQADGR